MRPTTRQAIRNLKHYYYKTNVDSNTVADCYNRQTVTGEKWTRPWRKFINLSDLHNPSACSCRTVSICMRRLDGRLKRPTNDRRRMSNNLWLFMVCFLCCLNNVLVKVRPGSGSSMQRLNVSRSMCGGKLLTATTALAPILGDFWGHACLEAHGSLKSAV